MSTAEFEIRWIRFEQASETERMEGDGFRHDRIADGAERHPEQRFATLPELYRLASLVSPRSGRSCSQPAYVIVPVSEGAPQPYGAGPGATLEVHHIPSNATTAGPHPLSML